MGDAYAKATGELTLVSVHSGPGLTNAITGIAEAAKSRTPLLVLAGDVPTGNVKSNFYFDQAELVRSVGAVSERIYTPQSARSDLLRAVTRVMRDRQTVVLSLPLDVQDAKLNGTNAPLELTPMPGPLHPDQKDVRRLAEAVSRAKRPLILAGRGAVLSNAEEALVALADRLGALLATSICGHGLFADNPWSVGNQRWLFIAGRRRADLRKRFYSCFWREPHPMDHQKRQVDRARNNSCADRPTRSRGTP